MMKRLRVSAVRRMAPRLGCVALLMATALAEAACGSSSGSEPSTDADAACAVEPTFASIRTQLLATATCSTRGCHATPGENGLSLDGDSNAVYQALVNAPSVGSLDKRVVPMSPETSFLYLKISEDTPPSGTRMPQGAAPLSACTIDAIKAWIAAGAPQNG